MKPIAVVTTVASRKEARAMAHALVEAKLAACAQTSRIRDLHSQELPAIHAFAFEHVLPAYAEWIEENTAV